MAETIESDKRDSIEVSRNAKKETSWKAKLYYNSATKKHTDVVKELVEIDTELMANFG